MFYISCRSLEVHWDPLLIFKCRQNVLRYKINGYHNLLFNTRIDIDDGKVELGYISVINLPIPSVKICQYLSIMYLSLFFFKFKLRKTYNCGCNLSSQLSSVCRFRFIYIRYT